MRDEVKCRHCDGELERFDKDEYAIPANINPYYPFVTVCRECSLEPFLLREEVKRVLLLLAPILDLMESGVLDAETGTDALVSILEREGALDLMRDNA